MISEVPLFYEIFKIHFLLGLDQELIFLSPNNKNNLMWSLPHVELIILDTKNMYFVNISFTKTLGKNW